MVLFPVREEGIQEDVIFRELSRMIELRASDDDAVTRFRPRRRMIRQNYEYFSVDIYFLKGMHL